MPSVQSAKPSADAPIPKADLDEAMDRLTFGGATLERRRLREPQRPFRRILVCVDGSERSMDALAWAATIGPVFQARAWVLSVLAHEAVVRHYARQIGWRDRVEGYLEADAAERRQLVDRSVAAMKAAGLKTEGLLARGFPAAEILDAAKAHGVDLVALGSMHHGWADRLLLGSVADGVKNHARASVLLAKGPPRSGPVLVPVDGSAMSRLAAHAGVRLAHSWGAETTLLHVFTSPVFGFPDEGRGELEAVVRGTKLPPQTKAVRSELRFGHAGRLIVDRAQQTRADLIVMGSRGLGGLRSLVAGSVSNWVSHHASQSVLLVKDDRHGSDNGSRPERKR